jgi:hypothetical protein
MNDSTQEQLEKLNKELKQTETETETETDTNLDQFNHDPVTSTPDELILTVDPSQQLIQQVIQSV